MLQLKRQRVTSVTMPIELLLKQTWPNRRDVYACNVTVQTMSNSFVVSGWQRCLSGACWSLVITESSDDIQPSRSWVI